MAFSFINEISLIQALKKGESEAYTYLVDTYHHKLCVYVYSLSRDYDLAEDIVQNVFVKIWKKRSKLKDNFSIKNYLYRSVYNEFIDQYRKNKPVLALEKKHIDALSSVTDDNENSLEKLIVLVKKEIENLPPKCKQTFLLSKQEGLTNIEIAEYLNVSIKSVEAHITKAFHILRKTVGEQMHHVLFLMFGLKIKNHPTT